MTTFTFSHVRVLSRWTLKDLFPFKPRTTHFAVSFSSVKSGDGTGMGRLDVPPTRRLECDWVEGGCVLGFCLERILSIVRPFGSGVYYVDRLRVWIRWRVPSTSVSSYGRRVLDEGFRRSWGGYWTRGFVVWVKGTGGVLPRRKRVLNDDLGD